MRTSVVIPAYKAERTIGKAIESLLESRDIEVDIIVVEDGCFDNTASIVEGFGRSVKLYSFSSNRGAQKARNFGLSKVITETVMFLDADDYVESTFLRALVDTLLSSSAGLAFGSMKTLYEDTGKTKLFVPTKGESRHRIAERWLRGQPGPHPCGVLWRTDVVRAIGGWHEDMARNQDGEIVLRALSKGYEVAVSDLGTSVYRCHQAERVSKRMTEETFQCQTKIIELIESWMSEDNSFDFNPSLSEFCIYVAIQAYKAGLNKIALEWESRSYSYSDIRRLVWYGSWKRKAKFLLLNLVGVKGVSKLAG